MKLLIAYDGSEHSDAAIVDLCRAGLPISVHAIVLSVAEIAVQPFDVPYAGIPAGVSTYPAPYLNDGVRELRSMETAQGYAARAADRLQADFPAWHIDREAWVDHPESAIFRKARAWNPDTPDARLKSCGKVSAIRHN